MVACRSPRAVAAIACDVVRLCSCRALLSEPIHATEQPNRRAMSTTLCRASIMGAEPSAQGGCRVAQLRMSGNAGCSLTSCMALVRPFGRNVRIGRANPCIDVFRSRRRRRVGTTLQVIRAPTPSWAGAWSPSAGGWMRAHRSIAALAAAVTSVGGTRRGLGALTHRRILAGAAATVFATVGILVVSASPAAAVA